MDTKDGIWLPVGTTNDTNFVADGLKKGSTYQFRVKAVNSEGKSDPLETEEGTQAKNPYEKPDKPEAPEITGNLKIFWVEVIFEKILDWDSDHVDLKWNPVLNDGGAPIEEYQVRMEN